MDELYNVDECWLCIHLYRDWNGARCCYKGERSCVKDEKGKNNISYESDPLSSQVKWRVPNVAGTFETNKMGDGIFYYAKDMRKQIVGTCDFSIRGLTNAYAKQKIRTKMKEWDLVR